MSYCENFIYVLLDASLAHTFTPSNAFAYLKWKKERKVDRTEVEYVTLMKLAASLEIFTNLWLNDALIGQ